MCAFRSAFAPVPLPAAWPDTPHAYTLLLPVVRTESAQYADKIGFKGQLLLEPKPREPAAHQYNFDAETTLGFLDRFGLTDRFSINLEANHGTLAGHSGEHEVEAACSRGKLGKQASRRAGATGPAATRAN